MIFVFGSNLAGRHGKGAALEAVKDWGAIEGQGEGLQGSSYALPTKDEKMRVRFLIDISASVEKFLKVVEENRHLIFYLTPVGTGLAGYDKRDIANIFHILGPIPHNLVFAHSWFDEDWWNDR